MALRMVFENHSVYFHQQHTGSRDHCTSVVVKHPKLPKSIQLSNCLQELRALVPAHMWDSEICRVSSAREGLWLKKTTGRKVVGEMGSTLFEGREKAFCSWEFFSDSVAHFPLSLEHPSHTLGGKMMKIIGILSQRYVVKVDRGEQEHLIYLFWKVWVAPGDKI